MLPSGLSPMLATPGSLPADDEGWSYEIKWDGVRALAYCAGAAAGVQLRSRNGNNVTAAYPELQALAAQLGSRPAVLDGEVCVFDSAGRTDFGLIQSRMHVRRPSPALIASAPVQFLIFDVLHLDQQPTVDWTYDQRRETLLGLGLSGAAWSTPPAISGDGATIVAQSKAADLEGIVAKRRDSRYLPGRRSPTWTKIKNIRRTSAVVVGWTPGEGNRAGQIGSLLLGVYGDNGFEYAGHVGTGFTQATLARLQRLLEPLRIDQSPLDTPVPRAHVKGAVWLQPVTVAEVDFTEWTRTGALRHPSFKGIRDDYDPRKVTRD